MNIYDKENREKLIENIDKYRNKISFYVSVHIYHCAKKWNVPEFEYLRYGKIACDLLENKRFRSISDEVCFFEMYKYCNERIKKSYKTFDDLPINDILSFISDYNHNPMFFN